MPVAETPAAVPLKDWRNPAPQDPASQESPDGSEHLLRILLEHCQELGLDSAQIGELSRLYWSRPLPTTSETIAAIEQRLFPGEFQKFIGYIAAAAGLATGSTPPVTPDVSALVKAALDERLKDKDVVAVDLAVKAADRLISWTSDVRRHCCRPRRRVSRIVEFLGCLQCSGGAGPQGQSRGKPSDGCPGT